MSKVIRVGVIGVSSARGWASQSHVPAVKAVAGLEFAGVTGKTQQAANETAAAFGAARGFDSVDRMIDDPSIDLITIAVRVPSHRELVLKALAAKKHVFCEWPLGQSVEESEEIRDAALESGVHAAIGLQTRRNPALLRAQQMLSDGAIGRILSARMYDGTIAFGPGVGEADSYLEDAANGATHLTIHGGHALDATTALLGPLARLNALSTVQYSQVSVNNGARTLDRNIADHILVVAQAKDSAAVIVEVDGGRPKDDALFRFEVTGEQGTLVLAGGAPVGFQAGRLKLTLNGADEVVSEGGLASLPDPAANVAAMYASLRDDIANDTWTTPDFAHAVRLTKLLADVDRASTSGTRVDNAGWPRG